MKPVRILIADDHTIVRAGIRSLLDEIAGYETVAEAGNGNEMLALVKEHHPDIVLMDISMPGMNGLEATTRIKHEFPDVRVIILSMHAGEEFVKRALQAGADAYLLKESATLELQLAIDAVMSGSAYLSPTVSRQVVSGFVRTASREESAQVLTPRQSEVLKLIAKGHNTKEIAYRLGISIKTVESHRAQIMERLEIRDVASLVRYAIRTGLVDSDDPAI